MALRFQASIRHMLALALVCATPVAALADSVVARRRQEPMHRSFLMKDPSGKVLATGEEVAVIQGDLVHSRLTFRFLDGSIDDEEVVFTQGTVFHLLSDHHIQRGPAFPEPVDLAVDVPSGKVTWHVQDHGKDEVKSQTLTLPDDVANGIVPLLVENFPPGAPAIHVSWVAIAIKPILATVSVAPRGTQNIDPAGTTERASEYVIHAELHGLVAFLAPLVDKLPADIHIWVTDEKIPSFVRLAGPFYQGGPIWTVESAGPTTP